MQYSYIYDRVRETMPQQMLLLAKYSSQNQWRPGIITTIADVYDELEMNCVMLIMYILYRQFSEKYSIRFYIKNNVSCNDEKLELIHLNYFQDGNHIYQDYVVRGYDKIVARYDGKNMDAKDINDTVHLCNFLMRNVIRSVFSETTERGFDLKELYIHEVKMLDNFFDDFIGRGQHIVKKDINEIRTKDFRDLYKQSND